MAELRPTDLALLLELAGRVARLERSDRRQTWDTRDTAGTLRTRTGLQADGDFDFRLYDAAGVEIPLGGGGGGGPALSGAIPLMLTPTGAAGTSPDASRADHQHPTTGLVADTDARLTNARTPTAHAASHAAAGSDPLTLSEGQVTGLVGDLTARPLDTAVVHNTGAETVAGQKTLSSPLLLPDGALATPAASFSADPDTGLRRSAANEMRLVTGGADRVTFDANGDVILAGARKFVGPNYASAGDLAMAVRLATDAVASNRFELYPGSVWFGAGGSPGPGGTDLGLERAADGTLNVYTGAVLKATIGSGAAGVSRIDGKVIGYDALASRVAATAAIANTETVVLSASLAAGLMAAGTTFRFRASGVASATGAVAGSTFRVRIGPTTLTGTIPASLTGTSAIGTNIPFAIECLVTVRTAGAAGTIIGVIVYNANAPTGNLNATIAVGQVTTAVAVNTTVVNLVELTYISGAAGTTSTFHNAVLELVKA